MKFRSHEEIFIKLKRKNQTLFIESNRIHQLSTVQSQVAAIMGKRPESIRLFLNMTPAEREATLKVIQLLVVSI